MPKCLNQKMKILLVRDFLQRHSDEDNIVTMNDIISMLNKNGIAAERKSVYDDIKTLMAYGMDISIEKGKNSGYKLLSRDFQIAELKLLVDAVQSSKFLTEKKSRELISKLEKLASERQGKELWHQVVVAGRIKSANETVYYNVDDINNAINNNKKISFKYYSYELDFSKVKKLVKHYRNGGGEYTVSPYKLVWDSENYYLISFDDKDKKSKHFRVDKMEKIKRLSDARDGSEEFKNFDMSRYTKSVFGMFGGEKKPVTLRFENSLANVVTDRFGHEPIFMPDDDEHFKFSVEVEISPVFFSWIFTFGEKAEILSPESVISEYKKRLEENIGLYSAEK